MSILISRWSFYTTLSFSEEKKDPMLRTGRSYLPVFQEFIRNNQLEERVSICTEAHGPPHHPTWRCIIKRKLS